MKKVKSKTDGVIHYHRDTEEICNSLQKGAAYKTSKGHAVFVARSQSNGKIMFRSTEERKNIYFTKQEWVDGKNSPKNIDKDYLKKVNDDTKEKMVSAVNGLIAGKSKIFDQSKDNLGNCEATYMGVGLYGIKVKYNDSAKTIVYFGSQDFRDRFVPARSKKAA